MIHRMLHPEGWAAPRGYAHGMSGTGRIIVLAGQIGWNAQQQMVSPEFVPQARQALENIVTLLAADGARPEHLVRLTWYVTNRRQYLDAGKALGEAYRSVMGRHFPAMTAVEVSALMEQDALVEIEATAIVPSGAG